MIRRRWLRVLLWLVAGYLTACAALGILLAELSMRLHHRSLGSSTAFRAQMRNQFGAAVVDASVTAADGAVLRAWYVKPAQANGEAVVLLHGVTDNRLGTAGYAELFLAHGYAVLMPDSRGHGLSGGSVATYGLLERDDVRRWVGWVRGRAPGCTYLLGESLGAAIGLEADTVTPQLCAVAVEDPYSTFWSVESERLGRWTRAGTLFWRTAGLPILGAAVGYVKLRYGLWLPDASPILGVRAGQLHGPALLIAGTEDHNIAMHHAEELAAACGGRCALWIVPGAGHGGASSVAHAEFQRRVLGWFAAHDSHLPVLR